jgi:WhiB family redox-sensing transcriptional regulator
MSTFHGLTVTMLADALPAGPAGPTARRSSRSGPLREGAEVVDLDHRCAGRVTAHTRAGDDTWWADARCNDSSGRLTSIFFSGDLQDIARARAICATCPALLPCLEGAIERREPCGVWGGQLFLDGKILATKRRRGRPRKLPRPEDILPHIHLPEHLRGATVAGDA